MFPLNSSFLLFQRGTLPPCYIESHCYKSPGSERGEGEEARMSATKYPWERWFKRSRKFRLRKSVNYDCSTMIMSQQARNAACRLGLSISIKDEEGAIVITIREKEKGGKR